MFRRFGLALAFSASAAWGDTAVFDSQLTLSSELQGFGGLSALELSPDGAKGWLLSDRGAGFVVHLRRESGRLSDAQIIPWPEANLPGDPEGLAIAEGLVAFSTEGPAVVRYIDGQRFPLHPDFRDLPENSALEALAVSADGTLWTIPEEPVGGVFRTYRLKEGAWHRGPDLPAVGRFVPTGADFGPDGKLYILERSFSLVGFRSRIRRMDVASGTLETLLSTWLWAHGNLEGIDVWQDQSGSTRLTLVADDNFLSVLGNTLAEYVLEDGD